MLNKFIFLIVLSHLVLKIDAQTLTYKSGQTFKSSIFDEIQLLQIFENSTLYLISSKDEKTKKREIMKLNNTSLEIEETLDLLKLNITGETHLIHLNGKELNIFMKTETKKGSKVVYYAIDVLRIPLDKKLSDYETLALGDFDEDKEPWVSYYPIENQYNLRHGNENKYFDINLNPIIKAENSSKPSGRASLNWRIKGMDYLDIFGDKQVKGTQSYFYPLFGGTNIYVESFYKSEAASYGKGQKVYLSIELSHYIENTESKTKVYIMDIKPGFMIIDYDCHLLKDTSVLIFGIYQEKMMKSGKLRLGIFSVRVDKNLKEISGSKYLNIIESKPDELMLNPQYKYIFSGNWGATVSYKVMDIENPNDIVLWFEGKDASSSYKFGCIKVDKVTGEIKTDILWNMCSTGLVWEDFTGFYHVILSDKLAIVFYNDHKKNTGKESNPPKLELCDYSIKTSGFSFVTYSTDTGFSKRNMLVTAASDKYLMDIESSDIAYLGKNEANEIEYILVAYDEKKQNGKFYKITIKE